MYKRQIEGRARGPEYVRTVVECYKEAIRSYLDGTFTDEKIVAWDERLKTVFNRGFWDGYYLGQRLGEWTKNYGSAATERKIYVGKGVRYFSNIGVAEFLVEAAELNVGDKLLITGPTTGAAVSYTHLYGYYRYSVAVCGIWHSLERCIVHLSFLAGRFFAGTGYPGAGSSVDIHCFKGSSLSLYSIQGEEIELTGGDCQCVAPPE